MNFGIYSVCSAASVVRKKSTTESTERTEKMEQVWFFWEQTLLVVVSLYYA